MITNLNFVQNNELISCGLIKLDKKNNIATVKSFKDNKIYKVNLNEISVSNHYGLKPSVK